MNRSRLPLHSSGLLALVFLLVGCGEVSLWDDQKSTIPVKKVLTDHQNREIAVTIIGRDPTHITFVRQSDNSRYRYPVSSLSGESRAFVETLPLVAPPTMLQKGSDSTRDQEPVGLKFARSHLSEIDEKLATNIALRATCQFGSVKERSLASEYERLLKDRAKIVAEISDLESK